MNHREPPHLPAGTRRALHFLSLLLLPAVAPEGVQALTRPRFAPATAADLKRLATSPYLPVLGAAPLRFEDPAPPPDLTARPAAAAPPNPALTPAENSVALANAAAAHPAAVEEPAPSAATEAAESAETKPAPPSPRPAPAVLPDQARPTVRPEDFLPFFQLPGSSPQGDVNVIVPGAVRSAPVPPPIPNSSATYRQSPR